jgi:hypothetical protein
LLCSKTSKTAIAVDDFECFKARRAITATTLRPCERAYKRGATRVLFQPRNGCLKKRFLKGDGGAGAPVVLVGFENRWLVHAARFHRPPAEAEISAMHIAQF